MAGGGNTEAMKVSDVFILVGISMLAAGFIMHAWVSPVEYEIEDGESEIIEKSFLLMKNDKLDIIIDHEGSNPIYVTVYSGGDSYQLIPQNMQFSTDLELQYDFTAEESGNYMVNIRVGSNNGDNINSSGQIIIDVQRSLMLDFIVYPIGAIMLAFGLYKRKQNQSAEVMDAELN